MTNEKPRKQWMNEQGIARSIDHGHQIIDDFYVTLGIAGPIDRFVGGSIFDPKYGISPVSAGMWCLSNVIHRKMIQDKRLYAGALAHIYTGADQPHMFEFENGLGDIHFAAQFAPFVAHEVIKRSVSLGLTNQEQFQDMSVQDMTDVLRMPWFNTLIHKLAFTSQFVYRQRGLDPDDYSSDADTPLAQDYSMLPKSELVLERNQSGGVSARLSQEAIQRLRKRMHEDIGSVGCPVAHKNFWASADEDNPSRDHAARLEEEQRVYRVRMGERGVQFAQYETPITRALLEIARVYEAYGAEFGTPVVVDEHIQHEQRPRTYPLGVV